MHCSRCTGSCSRSCRTCIVELILQGLRQLGRHGCLKDSAGTRKRRGHVFNVAKGLGSMLSPSATTTSPHTPCSPRPELGHHPQLYLASPTETCRECPTIVKENGTRIGRRLQVLSCSCLPAMVLEQSRSFLTSWGYQQASSKPSTLCILCQLIVSLQGGRSMWQPCLRGLLPRVEGHEIREQWGLRSLLIKIISL